MAFRTRWTRLHSRRLISAPALALAAALATVLPAAACASAPASAGASSSADARPTPSPAITAAQARQVFDRYVAAGAEAIKTGDTAPSLSLETGPQRAVDSASDAAFKALNMSASAIRQALKGLVPPAYTTPTYYLPEQSGYPHFFVADLTRKLTSDYSAGAASPISVDGAEIHPFGPELMLFEQASAGAPWLLASISNLAVGATLPKLATDSAGSIPTVPLADAALLAQPDDAGPLQAAVVDDGSASAATKAVANGPLTTGLYEGAVDHADELTPPHGDVYQWELEGTSYPEFALSTAAGGALVFYAMSLNATVAVPGYINKANPINSGPPIQVPADIRALLPKGQPAPLIQLQSQQTLSFASVDPATGSAKVQVIAMGGGLTSASAS
ncbi:MAG TPA: hypothetical protein VGG83_23065 [Trebonia sp.]